MKKQILFFLMILQMRSFAQQQVFPVSDTAPANSGGLTFGYNIVDEKEKEVSNKGDQSRFKIRFYITNNSNQAKLLLRKQGFLINSTSFNLVQFRCANATGARLTSKELTLQAKPCIVEAMVDDKDCSSGQTTQHMRPVNIGYWIQPGETISSNTIMIVPLNERPNITAALFPVNNSTVVGSAVMDNGFANNYTNQVQKFIRFRNVVSNTYLNNQNGPMVCSSIQFDWWSAQWELVPVTGTSYYLIRNRLRNNYISTDTPTLLSDNSQSPYAHWYIEPTGVNNAYLIHNTMDNIKLMVQNDVLTTTSASVVQPNAQWVIEQ